MSEQVKLERRRSGRVILGIPARLWSGIGWHQAICRDLSQVGLGLSVFRDLEPSEDARVTLELPNGEVSVEGRLVRGEEPVHVALEFDGLPFAARERIEACLFRPEAD